MQQTSTIKTNQPGPTNKPTIKQTNKPTNANKHKKNKQLPCKQTGDDVPLLSRGTQNTQDV